MKRFLTQAMMACLLGVGLASGETAGQPQPATTAASQAEQQETHCVVKNGMSSKEAKKQAKMARKQAKEAQKRARQEAEPKTTQDPVEAGGGG